MVLSKTKKLYYDLIKWCSVDFDLYMAHDAGKPLFSRNFLIFDGGWSDIWERLGWIFWIYGLSSRLCQKMGVF